MSEEQTISFIDMCVNGEALLDDIDDFVQKWHEGNSKEELYQFLGMAPDEYALWIAEPAFLSYIITAHKRRKNIKELIEEIDTLPLAARTQNPQELLALKTWITKLPKFSK